MAVTFRRHRLSASHSHLLARPSSRRTEKSLIPMTTTISPPPVGSGPPPKPLKQVADLTRDDDGDSEGGDGDHTEVSWLRTIRTAQHRVRLIPSFLIDRIQVADPNSVSPHRPLCQSHLHTQPTTSQRRLQQSRLVGRDTP